jgi:hypothetical protein
MRNRPVAGAVVLSLVVTGGAVVRLIAIGKPAVMVILVRALAGALLAVWRRGAIAVGFSAVLTACTATVLLIGGVGLLYVPSIALFIWGAASSEHPAERVANTP